MLVLSFAVMSPDPSDFGFLGEGENFFAAPHFPFAFPVGELFVHGEFMAFPAEYTEPIVMVVAPGEEARELTPRPQVVVGKSSNGATVVDAPILCSFPEPGFYGILLFPGPDGEQITHTVVEVRLA